MPKFMMLAMEKSAEFAGLSAEEMQAIIKRYVAWTDRMRSAGHLLDSNKLRDREGRRVSRRGSEVVVRDGPFSEAKEVIGGYWLLEADDYDTVVRLTKDSPHLDFGTLEIRQIDEHE